MNYWPAETTNLAECHVPLLDFLDGLAANGKKVAAANYGAKGWVAHHNSDIWAKAAPVGEGFRLSRMGELAAGRRVAVSGFVGALRFQRGQKIPA